MNAISPTQPPAVSCLSRTVRLAVAVAMAGVVWFYFWTVQSATSTVALTGQKSDYYNLLVDGFEDGHLYMKADPDPRLLALPPEQRPGDAPFKLDASLYDGHYYLYFGVAPVMTLVLPYALLTGHDLPEALAGVIFMAMGFALAVSCWLAVRRDFFPRLGGIWTVLGVLALGLCTAAPSALRRPMFYEVAIAAGYAFSMLALWAIGRAWRRPRQGYGWLALAGIAVGLAVGSRANLAPAGLILLCAGAAGLMRQETGPRLRVRRLVLALLAAGAGAGGVGAGLAGYNYARFGDLAEFGHHHQLGTNPKQMFRAENLRYNLGLYYFKPPALNGYFPFVAPADEAKKPSDYVGREHVHGEWIWTWLAAVGLLAGIFSMMKRREAQTWRWLGWLVLPGILFGVNAVVVGLTGVRSNRYMLDFHPALVLATLGLLAAGLTLRDWRGRVVRVAVATLLPLALVFNVLASLQVHGFFRATAPVTFARLSAWADGAVWPWLSSEAAAVGDRAVAIRWPAVMTGGRREPLLSAGTKDFRDVLFVDFDGAQRARFVFQHGEYGDIAGDWFSYTAGAAATLRISGGLLLPGVAHPWYGKRGDDERLALKRRLRVSVDQRVGFDRDVVSYDSSPRLQEWGEWRQSDGKLLEFSGRIERVEFQALDDAWERARAVAQGAIRLNVTLPENRFGAIEPLLQAGSLRGFDTLAVSYVRPGFVQLLHDQPGGGGRWSEEFAVDYARAQRVEISLPAASDGGLWAAIDPEEAKIRPELLRVRWNGRDVFRPELPAVPAQPLSVALGINGWNSSSVSLLFSGRLEESARLEPLGATRPGVLTGPIAKGEVMADARGVYLRLDRANGEKAALVWQRDEGSSLTKFGWIEAGRATWLAAVEPGDLASLTVRLNVPAAGGDGKAEPAWLELDVKNQAVFATKTDFFTRGAVEVRGLRPSDWQWNAAGGSEVSPGGTLAKLPGRLRVRFKLPTGGFSGADPLLSAGKAGAADSVFLRGLGGERYVLGVDHWGVGAVESLPVTLASDRVHTVLIELGSLGTEGVLARDRARLVVDGQVVLDLAQALYPVQPEEIVFGRNPLGMSTSNPVFRGDLISVRADARADEVR